MVILKPFILILICSLKLAFPAEAGSQLKIVGGGFIAFLEALYALAEAERSKKPVNIDIFERNAEFGQTPAMNIFPSLTPDEILAIIPRGERLVKDLAIPFNQGDGIKVTDVSDLNMQSKVVKDFVSSVIEYGKDKKGAQERESALLALGKLSMNLWEEIYSQGDDELRSIMRAANYKPCKEIPYDDLRLGQGYRIDIFRNHSNAESVAQDMIKNYRSLGYASSRVLLPEETKIIDTQLTGFVDTHSVKKAGEQEWTKGANAIWRPGGSLYAHDFMRLLMHYLKKKAQKMANGSSVNLLLDYDVVGVDVTPNGQIIGLNVEIGKDKAQKRFPMEQQESSSLEVVFAPGESVGTLRKLGFDEPDYAIFAGPSLRLDIPLTNQLRGKYESLNHGMEVHQDGAVLAWQAKNTNDTVSVGMAGTKAFYGDILPKIDEDFAKNRHLLQLNTVKALFPELIDVVLADKADNKWLTQADLDTLIAKEAACVWVGGRAVAYDGFPTLGFLYKDGKPITNGRVVTHLGSGGVSFGPAAIKMSKSFVRGGGAKVGSSELYKTVSEFSDSKRTANDLFKPSRRHYFFLRSLFSACKIGGLFGRVRCVAR